jgi:hypothetical protein
MPELYAAASAESTEAMWPGNVGVPFLVEMASDAQVSVAGASEERASRNVGRITMDLGRGPAEDARDVADL